MAAKKIEEAGSEVRPDVGALEDFVNSYLNAYRNHIIAKNADERHLPQFFKAYPFTIDVYDMPNKSICALFKKSNRSRLSVLEGDFDTVRDRLRDQDFDFMQIFPPFTNFTQDEAVRLAKLDADKDMRVSRRLELLVAAESHLADIHKDIQTVVELNPWLDQQTAEQKKKLDSAKELIQELYREVDLSREERFSEYAAQLADVMAFEKGEIEEVTSGLALQVEAAIEEMETRVSELEENAGNPEALDKMEARLAQLAVDIKEMGVRIKAIEKGGSYEKLDDAMSDMEEELEGQAKAIGALKKEFDEVKEDAAASKEIKETVFRDSKRTYNLNERVTDLERSLSGMKTDMVSSSKAEVKALEGRMNVLEKELKDYIQRCVRTEFDNRSPRVISGEPVVETTVEEVPGSPGVKKTTRKTTTKKTTRSK